MDRKEFEEKTKDMTAEELNNFLDNLTPEEQEGLLSHLRITQEALYQHEPYIPLGEIQEGLDRFKNINVITDFISDFDNTERYIYKLIENGKKRKNSINQDSITKLENDIKELRKVLNLRTTSQCCWKDVVEAELQISFSPQNRDKIKFEIEKIINANADKKDILYKNLYKAIIVYKDRDADNLYKNLMHHIQTRYIDIWDFAYKFKKFDIDEECYHLFFDCREIITNFIKGSKITELSENNKEEEVIESINKYVSFIYILHLKGEWESNMKQIIEDKENFINLYKNKSEIDRIQLYKTDSKSIALFKAKETIKIICDTIKGPLTTKMQFTPTKSKGLDDKKYIFNYLNNKNSLLNAMIYGIEKAIKECNVNIGSKIENELNIFIYNLIKELSPELLDKVNGGEQEHKSFITHRRLGKRRKAIVKFYCNLNYSKKENKNPYYIIYKPDLHYYTKNDDDTYNTKNITSFADLFGIN